MTMVSFFEIPHVQANKNIFNDFTKLYNVPNVSEAKLNTCKTCMASISPPNWNKYGLDLRTNVAFDRNNPIQAMKNLELLDSDGDKFINIDEIHNSTLPGNESDFPAIVAITVTASSTGTPAQTPAMTPISTLGRTEPKPSYTIMNGFSTVIVFAILYIFAIRKRRD